MTVRTGQEEQKRWGIRRLRKDSWDKAAETRQLGGEHNGEGTVRPGNRGQYSQNMTARTGQLRKGS